MTDQPDIDGVASSPVPWEDPPRQPPPSAAPILAVDGFEGPLDWLLELVRTERIDLRRLSILQLVEAFGCALQAALDGPARVDLSRWGEFLATAAQLALLRSRLLLPPGSAEAKAAQADAEALRRRLFEGAAMRRAASWLDARPQVGREVFARGVPAAEREAGARSTDIADLLRACLVALRVPEIAAAYMPARPPLWRVSDALGRITRLLVDRPQGGPLNSFLPAIAADAPDRVMCCRAAVASTLVAALELARGEAASLSQDGQWRPIRLMVAGHRTD